MDTNTGRPDGKARRTHRDEPGRRPLVGGSLAMSNQPHHSRAMGTEGVRAHLLPPARHPVVVSLVALGGELVLLHNLEHSPQRRGDCVSYRWDDQPLPHRHTPRVYRSPRCHRISARPKKGPQSHPAHALPSQGKVHVRLPRRTSYSRRRGCAFVVC